MNKKLMAVAVAGAFGAFGATAAFAQSSTVSLSGSLNYNYGYFDNGGSSLGAAAKVRTDALSNQESEWVMKGEEALGGGMSAFFMCSTSLDVTGSGASNMWSAHSRPSPVSSASPGIVSGASWSAENVAIVAIAGQRGRVTCGAGNSRSSGNSSRIKSISSG